MLILRGQAALAAILAIAAAIGGTGREGGLPETLVAALFAAFMVAGTVAHSTIDIASDGFCVDQLTRAGYGWGNSVQVGGSYLGIDVRRWSVSDAVGDRSAGLRPC